MGENDKRSIIKFRESVVNVILFSIKKKVWSTTFLDKLEQVKVYILS